QTFRWHRHHRISAMGRRWSVVLQPPPRDFLLLPARNAPPARLSALNLLYRPAAAANYSVIATSRHFPETPAHCRIHSGLSTAIQSKLSASPGVDTRAREDERSVPVPAALIRPKPAPPVHRRLR